MLGLLLSSLMRAVVETQFAFQTPKINLVYQKSKAAVTLLSYVCIG